VRRKRRAMSWVIGLEGRSRRRCFERDADVSDRILNHDC
jgi:hypothetical protein